MGKRAIALGFFDGIHIGHAALLRRLLEICSKTELTPTVITFDTLPQNLISKTETALINSPEDRVGLMQRMFGIEDIIFLHFDRALASMPWNEFVDYLITDYDAGHLIVGHNFRFGSGAKGSSELLGRKCQAEGIGCDVIADVICDGIVASSTYIRKLLTCGELERAAVLLGHPHVLTDVVRSGQRLGSDLGAPTLNMRFAPDVLTPAFGVYKTMVFIEDADWQNRTPAAFPRLGVTNIGTRPTVDDSGFVTVETHIPNFRQDLYGRKVRLEFHKYIRPEMKFNTLDELKAQIQKDRAAVMGG